MKISFLTTRERVRQWCIYMRLYTCGDNQSYSFMLRACSARALSLDDISMICSDIEIHSDDETIDLLFGSDKPKHVSLMETFINDCCTALLQ